MGDVVRFRKGPKKRGSNLKLLVFLGLFFSTAAGILWALDHRSGQATIDCRTASVIDGDTFSCDGVRIRLAGIDAPELPGHCRPGRRCAPGDPYASTEHLRKLLQAAPVECRKIDTDSYGRTVARCTADHIDLSCRQLNDGYAIRRYTLLTC
ncbi:thermonuclease family protein [Novosphingobium sp. NDB2Meth1]|uniref:thermonuclease family protein n=1 Tax=Novosphingobium sp. NDB2Meth1 TaxID=1892847 RepID=UPI0009FA789E|nr:thermonuclease family protein [Novosphingobium sp. NDB2Meth1]